MTSPTASDASKVRFDYKKPQFNAASKGKIAEKATLIEDISSSSSLPRSASTDASRRSAQLRWPSLERRATPKADATRTLAEAVELATDA